MEKQLITVFLCLSPLTRDLAPFSNTHFNWMLLVAGSLWREKSGSSIVYPIVKNPLVFFFRSTPYISARKANVSCFFLYTFFCMYFTECNAGGHFTVSCEHYSDIDCKWWLISQTIIPWKLKIYLQVLQNSCILMRWSQVFLFVLISKLCEYRNLPFARHVNCSASQREREKEKHIKWNDRKCFT